MTTLRKIFSLYSLLAVVVGAQGAILLFVHNFGNIGVDTVCGSILAGLAVLAFVAHGALASVTIAVPIGVYSWILKANGAVVAALAAGGMITQYVGTNVPALTPMVAVTLQGLALVASLFAGLVKASVTKRAQAALAR